MSKKSYRSPFGRRDEDPDLDTPFEEGKHFFSPTLTPFFDSPEVLERVPEHLHQELMVHQLYAYLNFTVRLELGPVNSIAELLSHRAFLPHLSWGRRSDAITIVADESKHARWSNKVMLRVEEHTGVRRIETEPEFLRQLRAITDPETPEMVDLITLFFVIVSETLITGSLNRLPKDESVQQAVRILADDHAKDEGSHHTYFKSMFEEVWPVMPRQLQTKIGVLLPSMLRAFLAPDRTYLTSVLRKYPALIDQPERVIDDLIASDTTTAGMLDSAKKSMLMFRKTGVFENQVILRSFEEHHFTKEALT